MSGGPACNCEGPRSERMKNWKVVQRHCNHSYFQYPGGAKHYSDWSSVQCLKCHRFWRTKAKYIDELPDAKEAR